ncbi:hypothetical protein TNCV_4765071 [Trichonephila clavipes]|nr:hypothetical protein TNCV_4765071 [Trichonephila clavipes]
MMKWGAIGYKSRSPLVHIDGIFNSARYISGVLRPVALTFIRVLRNLTFKQDNERPHVAVKGCTITGAQNYGQESSGKYGRDAAWNSLRSGISLACHVSSLQFQHIPSFSSTDRTSVSYTKLFM